MADEDVLRTRVENPDAALPYERGGPRGEQAVTPTGVLAPEALPAPQGTTSEAIGQDEAEQRQQAREAREVAPRGRRQVQPPTAPMGPEKPVSALSDEELRTRYLTGPQDDGVELLDRLRLNRQDAFYRGSVAGSARLAALAHIYTTEEAPDFPPERKEVNKRMREEYQGIVADLAAYDEMQSFGTTTEALVSLGGQLEGTLISPESWIGWGAKGATWLGRTVKSALQQGVIQGATDPVVQALDIQAQVQDEYDPMRTVAATGLGALIGGGAHLAGEGLGRFIGQKQLRKQLADLAQADESFSNLMMAKEALDPRNGLILEPSASRETIGEPAAPPVENRYGAGPEHGFEDTVKSEKERLAAAYGAAQPKRGQLNDDARFAAFYKEVGPDVDGLLEHYGLDRQSAHDLYEHYERAPGQHPKEALEQAIDRWAETQERAAMQALEGDSEWAREMDVLNAHFAAELERPSAGGVHTDFRGRETVLPGGTYDPRPTRVESDIPFPGEEAAGSRGAEPGSRAAPGEEGRTAGGGEGTASGGGRAGERDTGVREGEGGERQAAEVRGERVADAVRNDLVLGPAQKAVENLGSLPEIVERWSRDPDRVHAELDAAREKVRLVEGEIAKKYGVSRRQLPEIEDRLTPEEAHFLYYGDAPTAIESLDEISRQLAPVDSLPEAAREIYFELKRLPEDLTKLTTRDALTLMRLQTLAFEVQRLKGDIREVLKDAFRQYGARFADPNDAADMVEHALGQVYKLHEAGFKFESGAEGKPQMLLPGVEPITDRDRLDKLAKEKMQGGNAPPPAGGLFDEDTRAQGDLLGLQGGTGERPDLEAIAQRKSGGALYNEQDRPEGGVAGAPSPAKDVAIRSLQQQSTDLAEALDFPLRQGRVQSRGALGTFSRRTGVVRVREVPDFEVVAHEGGHALEAKMGQELTDLTEEYGAELGRLDYDQGPGGQRVNEGFAEYVRLYVGNPAAAANLAPTFTPAFRDFMMQRRPDLMQAIDRTAQAYRDYLEAPSTDAVGAVRRSAAEDLHGWRRIWQSVREDGLPDVVKSFFQKSYDRILDDKAPLARAVRELGILIRDRTGAPAALQAADNPAVLLRMRARAQQAALRDMMDGVRPYGEITPAGPSLANAMAYAMDDQSVWGKWDQVKKADFSSYLIAKRAEYLWRKFDAGDLPNPPVAFSAADARMAIDEFERLNPRFRTASDVVHQYSKQLVRKQFEGGLITRELADKLMEEEFYVPFMRDMSDKPSAGGGFGSGAEGPGTTETVRRIRGSARDIKDPIESLMMQTFLINRTLRHNDIIKALVDLAERAGPEGGRYVEPILAHEARKYTFDLGEAIERKAKEIGMMPEEAQSFAAAMGEFAGEDPLMGSYWKMERTAGKGEPIIFYKDGGELKAARLMSGEEGHALYELLTAAPEPVTDLWQNLIATAAAVKRSGIVTNPMFALSNYIRDQFAASILRSDYVPIISGMRGIVDEFRQANSAVLYGYAGGVSGGASVGPVERAVEANVDALKKKGYLVNRVTSFKGLMELSSFTEAGTRNSIFSTVFDAGKKRGLSDYEALVEAAYQAQDLLDFSRHGSHTMAIRNMLPFLNAHMQGLDKARRTLINPIVQRMRDGQVFEQDSAEFRNAMNGLLKFGAVGGSLGAVWAALNWEKESYRDANPYFKGTHVIVPWGNKIIVLPKPFELGLGFTFGEYAFQRLMQDDPRAGTQFMEAAWQTLQPPNPFTDIPIVSTTTELMTGKSLFTNRDIVPERLQRVPAPMQYDDRTSELAKWLGKETGLSPIKIEYAIGSQFGNWGRDVMAMSQGVNEDAPAHAWDDAVFLRRFIKDPTRSSDATTRFWDFMGRTTGKFNQDVAAYDGMLKEFRDGDAKEFLAKLPAAEKAFVTMKSAADEFGKPAFKADEKRLHPLQRAYDAVTLLNGLRRELASNNFATYETGAQHKLSPDMRRDLLENIRELAQMEMRNALVITGEPSYEKRPVLDPNDTMDKIKALSPEVAAEIATRYATAKIYKTEAVRKAWPQVQKELVRNGSQADIAGEASDAKADGPEFEGERVRKPIKRRIPVAAAP